MSLAQYLDPQLETVRSLEMASEPRFPVLLIADTSRGMHGKAIEELNQGLALFQQALLDDPVLMNRVEVAVVSYGPTQIRVPFQKALAMNLPELSASGEACLGEAVSVGLDLLSHRGEELHKEGQPFVRPWVFLLSSGTPSDEWRFAAWQVKEGEMNRAITFFAIDVAHSDLSILQELSVREPFQLKDLRFRDLFLWLAGSLQKLSRSVPGQPVHFDSPFGPNGWASIL